MSKLWSCLFVSFASLIVLSPSLHAQAIYTANQNNRIQVGVGAVVINPDYTEGNVLGFSGWADYDFSKYVGVEFVVLYASNGEVAILPVNPETGMVDLYKWHLAHLAEFVKDRSGKTKRQADRVSVVEL